MLHATTATPHDAAPARIEELESELGEFAYLVSHDLAATFRQVRGYLGLLTNEIGETLTPQQNAHAEKIGFAAAKCQSMLDQLLIYSRAQQRALALSRCDVNLLLDCVRLQLGADIRDSGAEIDVEPLGAVTGDESLLTDGLRHILEYALSRVRDGATPKLVFRRDRTSSNWIVRISHNGEPVPKREWAKAFAVFYQMTGGVELTTVGSALAIARRIFRRHCGDVYFDDAASGACLVLRLPPSDLRDA